MTGLVKRTQECIRQMNMIPCGARVLVGLSGGADSTALLLVLAELAKELDFHLEALHVEHGIRGEESLADADFAEALCRRQGIACRTVHVDALEKAKESGCSLEEAARLLRYEEFRKWARQRAGEPVRIALAHHLDDNAETILFQMVRGSGPAGLGGMKPIHADDEGMVCIRPFLRERRADIEAYLAERGQDYCTDSTNLLDDAARNRIRHHVMPALETVNKEAAAHISAAGARLLVVQDYLSLQVEREKERLVTRSKEGWLQISAEELGGLHPAIAGPLVLELLAETAGKRRDFGDVHVQQMMKLLSLQSGRRITLPWGTEVLRLHDTLQFVRTEGKKEAERETHPCIPLFPEDGLARVEAYGCIFDLKVEDFDGDMTKIPKKQYNKWFDYDKIESGLVIRTRRAGDYLLCGPECKHKKLQRLMIDEKVPNDHRDRMPLLAEGSRILWVIGGRIGDNYKVTPETKRVLEIDCRPVGEEYNGLFSTL